MLFTSISLAFVQLIFIVSIAYLEYRRKSISIFLWAMLFVLFGLMHFITVLSNSAKFPLWVYDNASLFVICFCFIYLITRAVCPVYAIKFSKWSEISEHSFTCSEKRFIKVTVLILFITVAYRIHQMVNGVGGLLETSWSSGRDVGLESEYFNGGQIIICLYNYACSAILLSIFCKKRNQAIFCTFLIIACVIITRNRVVVLPIMVSVIAYYLYNGTKMSLNKILALGTIGIMSVLAIYALQIFRYYGNFIQFADQFELNDFTNHIFQNMSEEKGDIGLREVFYYFIYHNNQFENFGEGHTYIRMLLVFIPTSWSMGLKPPDFAISMGTAMGTGIEGFSTHPTLFGDCFANFGYCGIFMGIFWALFVQVFDYMIYRQKHIIKICLIVLCGNAYIIMGRGSIYNAFIWMLWGIILMFIIHYISNSKIFSKNYENRNACLRDTSRSDKNGSIGQGVSESSRSV